MRPVMIGDLLAAARALMPVPPPDRKLVWDQMISQTIAADKFRKRLGRNHPTWGDGSLMARALLDRAARHAISDTRTPDFRACLQTVICCLDPPKKTAPVSQRRS
jgi:hypothetical protein